MKSWTPIRHRLCLGLLLGVAGTASAQQSLPPNVHLLVDTSGSMRDLPQVLNADHRQFFNFTTDGCSNPWLDAFQSAKGWDPATVYPVPDIGTGVGSDLGFPNLFQDNKFYAYGYWADLSSPTPHWSTKEQACQARVPSWSANLTEYNQCLSCLSTKGYFKTSAASMTSTQSTSLDFILWGRFLNFNPPKYVAVRAALKQVLEQVQGMRVGYTRFNTTTPTVSRLERPQNPSCSQALADPYAFEAHKSSYISSINALGFNTSTPLARTLLNIGYYFTSDISIYRDVFGFGPSGTSSAYYNYPSEFQNTLLTSEGRSVCWGNQANAVVIVTDGEPVSDTIPTTVLNQLRVLNGGAVYCPASEPCIGKRNSPPYSDWPDKGTNTANDSSGWPDDNLQFLLDDVARLLHTQDLQRHEPPVVGSFDTSGAQTLRIHTIAYSFQSNLLKNTALVGGGLYFTAHDAAALRESLLCILSNPDTNTAACAPTP